jgi:hypothetical protein
LLSIFEELGTNAEALLFNGLIGTNAEALLLRRVRSLSDASSRADPGATGVFSLALGAGLQPRSKLPSPTEDK